MSGPKALSQSLENERGSLAQGLAQWHNLRGVRPGPNAKSASHFKPFQALNPARLCPGQGPSGQFDRKGAPTDISHSRHTFDATCQENEGFGVIMKNFNHERWGFVVQDAAVRCFKTRNPKCPTSFADKGLHQATRFSRVLLEELEPQTCASSCQPLHCAASSWNFANKRSTFGPRAKGDSSRLAGARTSFRFSFRSRKRLVEHPVIRWKLAEMTRQAFEKCAVT